MFHKIVFTWYYDITYLLLYSQDLAVSFHTKITIHGTMYSTIINYDTSKLLKHLYHMKFVYIWTLCFIQCLFNKSFNHIFIINHKFISFNKAKTVLEIIHNCYVTQNSYLYFIDLNIIYIYIYINIIYWAKLQGGS